MKTPSLMVIIIVSSLVMGLATPRSLRPGRRQPKSSAPLKNVEGKSGLAEMLAGLLPNTYYSKPKYRFPYYHQDGKARVSSFSFGINTF